MADPDWTLGARVLSAPERRRSRRDRRAVSPARASPRLCLDDDGSVCIERPRSRSRAAWAREFALRRRAAGGHRLESRASPASRPAGAGCAPTGVCSIASGRTRAERAAVGYSHFWVEDGLIRRHRSRCARRRAGRRAPTSRRQSRRRYPRDRRRRRRGRFCRRRTRSCWSSGGTSRWRGSGVCPAACSSSARRSRPAWRARCSKRRGLRRRRRAGRRGVRPHSCSTTTGRVRVSLRARGLTCARSRRRCSRPARTSSAAACADPQRRSRSRTA